MFRCVRTSAFAAAMLATAVLTTAAVSEGSVATGTAPHIGFLRKGELFVVSIDGTKPRRVVDSGPGTSIEEFAWAPNGDTIAVPVTRGEASFSPGSNPQYLRHIVQIEPNGTHRRRLTRRLTVNVMDLAWSRDSRRLAFVRWVAPTSKDLVVLNVGDGGERELGIVKRIPQEPTWSPDSSRLAFAGGGFGDGGIFTIRLAGRAVRRITANDVDTAPNWSPDGRTIAFVRDGVWTTRPDGSGERRLAAGGFDASWSPDGRQIAFARRVRGSDLLARSDIWLVGLDGKRPRRLTSGAATDTTPSWSSDGEHIAFTRESKGRSGVFVLNTDGTGLRRLTAGPYDTAPAWQPARR